MKNCYSCHITFDAVEFANRVDNHCTEGSIQLNTNSNESVILVTSTTKLDDCGSLFRRRPNADLKTERVCSPNVIE